MKPAKIVISALLIFTMFSFSSTKYPKFPSITGTTLKGKEITLPIANSKKFCLIAIASSISAEEDLESWIDPMYNTFMGNVMFQTDMYFIPMTGGIKGVSNETVERKLKQGIDSSLYNYVLMYTGPTESYVKTLKMKDKSLPYLFVLNPRGEITYTTTGKYTEEKLEAITDKLSE